MPIWLGEKQNIEETDDTRIDRIQKFIRLKGKPFSFKYHPFLVPLLATPLTNFMLMAGRQVSKSTTLCALICEFMMAKEFFNINYITPLKDQAARFSTMYLKPMIEGSPAVKDIYLGPSTEQNVFRKSYNNGSVCNLQYAFLDAERIRGTPADCTLFDECQDILWDVIPEIKECMGFSDYKWEAYTGTAKTLDNTIEKLWCKSTMREWVIKCQHCGTHNVPTTPWVYKMIRPHGLSCYKCGKVIDVSIGEWVGFNKKKAEVDKRTGQIRDGFHIPQIIVPKNVDTDPAKADSGWPKILQKQAEYPPGKFANEVLGISFDMGGRLITLTEIKEKCCQGYKMSPKLPKQHGCQHIVIGVDWGISAQTSFTVAVAMGITAEGLVKIFYAKKFLGTDIMSQISEILQLAQDYKAQAICCDFGVGFTNNQILRQRYGNHRVFEFQYVRSKSFLKWDGNVKRYMLGRTASLNVLFMNMKNGIIHLPKYEEFEPFIEDIMSEYEEIVENSGSTVKVFLHTPDKPDDFLHAMNFGWVGLCKLVKDPILNTQYGDE